jgi:molecular chaperone DnaK (HSP70)
MLKLKILFNKKSKANYFFNKNLLLVKKFSSVISIDMGATNTCIALYESSGPRVIENAEGKNFNK